MNPKVQQLLDSVKQLVTEIEGGESEMPEGGMEEDTEDESMSEGEGGAEVEIEMKPMQKRMGGGGMPESLRKFTGGR
jgi:hypothetical protein